jgi:hypothetical protein
MEPLPSNKLPQFSTRVCSDAYAEALISFVIWIVFVGIAIFVVSSKKKDV